MGCADGHRDGIHIEVTAYAKQIRYDLLNPYSMLVLENAADATAQYCLKYDSGPAPQRC